jgi:ubiquinone biosynthesis protein Coq4|tara:strand:+ start:3345 stop:4208 length:864 start_codon:yes stop_codon:yes gene_type:complete
MSTDASGFGDGANADNNGEHRLDHIVNMYREMNFPFGPLMAIANRKTMAGRNILWGRGKFSSEHFDNVVVPKLMDFDYLKSLAPNTVGAHYYNLIKGWGIEGLYNQRFKHEEMGQGSGWGMLPSDVRRKRDGEGPVEINWGDEVRVNLSRHLLLSHDFWHVLFRYDTATMGEAMIQEVTAKLSMFKPPRLVSFLGTWKMARKVKSNLPWKVRQECIQLAKDTDRRLFFQDQLSLLERDIQEVRKEYNIGVPVVYKKFVEEFGEAESRLDTFHPQYCDVAWEVTEASI